MTDAITNARPPLVPRWQDRSDVFLSHLLDSRIHERMCDCTLACSGQFFKTHRLVLSMSSQYFQNILESTPSTNPVIVLPEVEPTHIEKILEYIYTGETSIPYEVFPAISNIASQLKIKGFPLYVEPYHKEYSRVIQTEIQNSFNLSSNPQNSSKINRDLNVSDFHELIFSSRSTSPNKKPPSKENEESICLPNRIKISWHTTEVEESFKPSSQISNLKSNYNIDKHCPEGRNRLQKIVEFKSNFQPSSFQDLVNRTNSRYESYTKDNSSTIIDIKQEPLTYPTPITTDSHIGNVTSPSSLSSRSSLSPAYSPDQKANHPSETTNSPITSPITNNIEIDDINKDLSDKDSYTDPSAPILSAVCNSPLAMSPKVSAESRMDYASNLQRSTSASFSEQIHDDNRHYQQSEYKNAVHHTYSPEYKLSVKPSLDIIAIEPSKVHDPDNESSPKPSSSQSTFHIRKPPPLLRLIDQPPKESASVHINGVPSHFLNKSMSQFRSHLLVPPTPTSRSSFPHQNAFLQVSMPNKLELQNIQQYGLCKMSDDEDPINLSPSTKKFKFSCCESDNHTLNSSDPLLEKIPTHKRKRVRGPKCWEFLLRLLRDPECNPSLIKWENIETSVFRLIKPDIIAQRWGRRTGKHCNESLTYENFARGLRYHYATGALMPVSEKSFVYQFGPRAQKALQGIEEIPMLKI